MPKVKKLAPSTSDPNWLKPAQRTRTRLLSEAMRERLARVELTEDKTGAEKAADRIYDIMAKGKDSAAIMAASMYADRTEGKPMQQLSVQHSIDENTLKHISELAEKFLTE